MFRVYGVLFFVGPGREVAGGHASPGVAHIDKASSPVFLPKCGCLFGLNNLCILLHGFGKGRGIYSFQWPGSLMVNNNGLESFSTHNRAQTTPACMTAGPAVVIGHGYSSGGHFHLTAGTDGDNNHLLAESFFKGSHGIVIA